MDTASNSRKKCLFCGEMILAEAIKCRFCGEFVAKTLTRRRVRILGRQGRRSLTNPALSFRCCGRRVVVSSAFTGGDNSFILGIVIIVGGDFAVL